MPNDIGIGVNTVGGAFALSVGDSKLTVTGGTLYVASHATPNVYSFPDSSTVLVGEDTAQTLSNKTIVGYAPAGHTHVMADITDFIAGGTGSGSTIVAAGGGLDFTAFDTSGLVILGTPSTLTSSTTNAVTTTSHTHEISLSAADVGAASENHAHGNITAAGAIGTTDNLAVVTSTSGVLTTASRNGIDSRSTFPPDSHTHDERYYTESEVTALLGNKSDTSHTHTTANITDLAGYTGFDVRYYTESEVTALLVNKSDSDHTHTLDVLTDTVITSNSAGEILRWNGDAWVNNTLAEAGIAAASHTHTKSQITDFSHTHTSGEVTGLSTVATTGAYSDLSGIPSTFSPSPHAHGNITSLGAIGSISGLVVTTSTGGTLTTSLRSGIDSRSTFPPSAHTHTKGEITDFSHGHPISEITNLQSTLDGKASTSHTHTLANITDSGTSAALDVPSTGDAAVGEVVKGDDTRLTDARTPTTHTHDDRYYTEGETDTLLGGKANTSHTHTTTDLTNLSSYTGLDSRYYTESETDSLLSGKANTSHTHTRSQITDFAHTHAVSEVSDSTTVGQNLVKLINPNAITFPRFNADNSVSALSAEDFRIAIDAGAGAGALTNLDGGNAGSTYGGVTAIDGGGA